jgi:hypothetical protein
MIWAVSSLPSFHVGPLSVLSSSASKYEPIGLFRSPLGKSWSFQLELDLPTFLLPSATFSVYIYLVACPLHCSLLIFHFFRDLYSWFLFSSFILCPALKVERDSTFLRKIRIHARVYMAS